LQFPCVDHRFQRGEVCLNRRVVVDLLDGLSEGGGEEEVEGGHAPSSPSRVTWAAGSAPAVLGVIASKYVPLLLLALDTAARMFSTDLSVAEV
jgi:hypothetical protein